MTLNVKIKLTHPEARVPRYANQGDACFDLHALLAADGANPPTLAITIPPGESRAFDTGLAFEVPAGHVLKVFSRSGHGFKSGIRLGNGTGIIDSGYRDSVKVKLHNDGKEPFTVRDGDRIAQALIQPVPLVTFEVVDELAESERGLGGLGSTGS